MSDIIELEKRIAKLEENLSKIVGIIVQASEERQANASETVIAPPHMMSSAISADYLVSDVDYSDETAMDLASLMVAADEAKNKKIELQSSLMNKKKGE